MKGTNNLDIVDIPKNDLEKLNWYLRKGRKGQFCFDVSEQEIFPSIYGFDAFSVFYIYKKTKVMLPTKQPAILQTLYNVEESVSNMARGVAIDFKNNVLTPSAVDRLCDKHQMPSWFKDLIYRYRNEFWGGSDI